LHKPFETFAVNGFRLFQQPLRKFNGFYYYCIENSIILENMKRFGQIIGVRPENFERYKKYHAAVWPEVLDMIKKCNMQNYSIFHKDGMLYAYFEYTGTDFAADMAKMAADSKTREWWAIMEPMQDPVATRKNGEWWANMEEVFHLD
jgi:L-rhamnose mutarotase